MEKYFLIFFLSLSACGGGANPSSSNPIDNYVVINNSFSEATSSGLEGSGKIVFNTQLAGPNSDDGLTLVGELINNSSMITVVTHASSTDLTDGNHLIFSASGLNLLGQVKINSLSPIDIDNLSLNLFSSNSFSMTVDFYDIGSSLRILIWNDTVTSRTSSTADFDSLTNSQQLPASTGSGSYAGLILTQARVNKAQWGGPFLSGSLH